MSTISEIILNAGYDYLTRDQQEAINDFEDLLTDSKIILYRHMEIISPDLSAITMNPGDHWSFSPDAILENGDVVNVHLTAEIDISQVQISETIECLLGYPEEREIVFSGDVWNLLIEVDE